MRGAYWDPFVPGALAIERTPGVVCLSVQFSSAIILFRSVHLCYIIYVKVCMCGDHIIYIFISLYLRRVLGTVCARASVCHRENSRGRVLERNSAISDHIIYICIALSEYLISIALSV